MMKSILVVAFLLLSTAKAEFIRDNALEVVNDTTTCLMWQDDNATTTVKKNWQNSIDYCENLDFAGFIDWRLPNFNELYSIGDRSKSNPAIKDAFMNVEVYDYYWSSTTRADGSSNAWVVLFGDGNGNHYFESHSLYVRCVRDGQ